MHITRLRLLGFKSFVEPTELLIEPGLTGVVGPNGCGKSNLLEALRWVMGETSTKSMRAASMDDVIFNGTTTRPARNIAEVAIVLDNSQRTAPAELNTSDVLEITRRIERDMGSSYRLNGKDTRAKDIKILFEDAATGARSPALVRQGQISEIVNAKPEQRRRVLEDAAGVAGLHSRRHDAELRLKAAELNLTRVTDVLGQMSSHLAVLRRQATQARRYRDLSDEIRRAEALLLHILWSTADADVLTGETMLGTALSALSERAREENALIVAEREAAESLRPLREAEMAAAASVQRLKNEETLLAREIERTNERERALKLRIEEMKRDQIREDALLAETRDARGRLKREIETLQRQSELATSGEVKAQDALRAAEAQVKTIDQRLAQLQSAVADVRARRKSLETQKQDRLAQAEKIARQVAHLQGQLVEVRAKSSNIKPLDDARETLARLTTERDRLLAALAQCEATRDEAMAEAQAAEAADVAARLALGQLTSELKALDQLLVAATHQAKGAPVLDALTVSRGFEKALAAALGEDLEATAELSPDATARWTESHHGGKDPALPQGAVPLAQHIKAPKALARRLAQIGLVDADAGDRLAQHLLPGQRLISREGDLWRWDGFRATRHRTTTAAVRLEQSSRRTTLIKERAAAEAAQRASTTRLDEARAHVDDILTRERDARQQHRSVETELDTARTALQGLERAHQDVTSRMAALDEALATSTEALAEARERTEESDIALDSLPDVSEFEDRLSATLEDASDKRSAVADARAALAQLEDAERRRSERREAATEDLQRLEAREASAIAQRDDLAQRLEHAFAELEELALMPDTFAERRDDLLTAIHEAEAQRARATDAIAAADEAHRQAQSDLRDVQAKYLTEREVKARLEANLDAARARRHAAGRRIAEAFEIEPHLCLALSQHPSDAPLPDAGEVERTLHKLKADREKLGGVNLAADTELQAIEKNHSDLEAERADVEAAIGKLRNGIAVLNREARQRLRAAFEKVNAHFQQLFTTLFSGGEARLEMIESPDDPLDGGLEIIAKPPGKKPATLSLLSGGEQTLTALSLIFAVFLTNPSPICVLDEVDAPLDDANVERFCTMMEKMASDTATRFLVITHHPMTMSRMNRLFGVTMAEKGVSQLVSVDLEAARRFVEADAA